MKQLITELNWNEKSTIYGGLKMWIVINGKLVYSETKDN